jgi:HD superfamily phosphodiesterase
MNRKEIFRSAETSDKQILEDFFISVFREKNLSSHGIDHHRRVWRYAKDLFPEELSGNEKDALKFAIHLMIACYLHDAGMSIDPGIKHGKHSRRLCSEFLSRNNLAETDYSDVLEAIEYHDDKNYPATDPVNDLLKILSVADDLDAFGYIGIFRYCEIYLTRGVDTATIGYMIRENAVKRFNNFVKSFGTRIEIISKHTARYNVLDEFCKNYNDQLPGYHFGTANPAGPCGAVELFSGMLRNESELNTLLDSRNSYRDKYIKDFLHLLKSELSDVQ